MDIVRAKSILESLAQGVDPLTGEFLPDGSVCNQAEIIRAFFFILHELQKPHSKQTKTLPPNAGKAWTAEEESHLCELFEKGLSTREISQALGRTVSGIASRLMRLGRIMNIEESIINPGK